VLGLEYGKEIDIWSLACVLSEMLTGYPLFCADDEAQLIEKMVEMRGLPPLALVKQAPRAHYYFDEGGQLKQKAGSKTKVYPGSRSITDATKIRDPGVLDLMNRCLQWAPEERLTADQMLQHPWLQQAAEPTDGPQSAR
jgi:dual specificity tyrosine-phosphorylation-regulated kinase 2/3/4